nr:MFS transporter [Janthinobacterium sp. FT58W]
MVSGASSLTTAPVEQQPESCMSFPVFPAAASARGSMAVILLSVLLNFAGFTIIIPVLPFSVARHAAPGDVAFWVALILSLYALCSFLAAPVLGAISDRHGRRPVLLLSLCGSAVGFAVFGVSGSLWVLLLGRMIEGLSAGSISTLYACIADTHAPHERGPAFGLLGVAGGLGFMLGPVLGGLLGSWSLAAPLYGAAGLALLNALLVWRWLPESLAPARRSTAPQKARLNAFSQLRAALRVPVLRLLFGVVFCFALASVLLQSNLALLMKDLLALTPAAIGLVLAGIGVIDIVSQGLVARRLLPRVGEQRLAGAGLLINAAGLLVLAWLARFPFVPLLLCGVALFTFGDGLFQPSVNALIADAAPEGRQGEVQGANQAQQSIARMFGPPAGAWLYALHPGAPYAVAALVGVVAAMVLASKNIFQPPASKPARPV